jgi:hypothetical protein
VSAPCNGCLQGSTLSRMQTSKPLTIQEFARMGGLARARKHTKRQLREWGKRGAKFGKLGGRPNKSKKAGAP